MIASLRRKVAAWLMGPELRRQLPGKAARLVDTYPVFRFGTAIPRSEWTAERAVREGLKVNPWVYACVQAYAMALMPVPHKVQRKNGEQWEDVQDHPAAERFQQPNKDLSRADLLQANIFDLFTSGNMVTSIVDSTTAREPRTLELWPLQVDRVTPIPDELDFVKSYRIGRYTQGMFLFSQQPKISNSSTEKFEDPRNIVHVKFWDPSNPWWGLSPLQAASRVIDTDVAAIVWNLQMLENRAVASGVFSTPMMLEKDQHAKLKAILKDEIAGAENAYGNLLLTHGTTWTETSRNALEMDWTNSRKLSREEICAVLRTPPPIVGISENATLANQAGYERAFYQDSVIPVSGIIMEGYNRAWIWPRWGNQYRLAFDFARVPALNAQRTEKIQDFYRLWLMGYPANMLNRYLDMGLPDTEAGDQSWVPTNLENLQAALAVGGPQQDLPLDAGTTGGPVAGKEFASLMATLEQLRFDVRGDVL